MNWQQDLAGENPELELEVEQALKHFKASMDAWSDAALSRPRTVAKTAVRHGWRPAASWALGCLLAAGTLAGAVHQIVQRQEIARQAAQKAAQKAAEERAAAAQATAQPDKKAPAATTQKVSAAQDSASGEDEALLASVDSDVSREVPAAMEPLAQLMDDNGTQ
ncbi:MAG: hypothetical protein ABSD59_03155 [Terracidiphilus sp.]|jgi:hypothetical protein